MFRCVIGGGVKLNDSVIMEGVKIGAGAIIQNSVICAEANIGTLICFQDVIFKWQPQHKQCIFFIGDNAVLKNCQVAAGFEVPAGTKGNDECFNEMGVHSHSDDDMGADDAMNFEEE